MRKERIQIRFPDHVKARIEEMARELQKTEGQVVVELVERALSVDPQEMNQKIIHMHETIQSLLEWKRQIEEERGSR